MANVPSSRTIGSVSSTWYNSGTREEVNYTITFYLITSYTQSASANTSTVSMHVRASVTGGVPFKVSSWAVTGNGGTKSGSESSYSSVSPRNFASSSKTLTHSTSGTCSFSSGATVTVSYYTTLAGSGVNKAINKTLTLNNASYSVPTINVYSTLSFNTTSPTMGNNCVMTISKASCATSGVRIRATYDSADHTIYTGSANSYTWSVPDLASTTPNSATKNITISIQSVKGSTYYAAKTYTLKAKVPASYVPEIQIDSVTDDIGWSSFVVGWSKLTFDVSAGLSDNVSTISKYALEVRQDDSAGILIYSTSISSTDVEETLAMAVPITSTTVWAKVTVTDSRGRTASDTTTINAVAYAQPQMTISASRCDSLGNPDAIGNYIKVEVTWSITQISTDNYVTENLVTYLSTDGNTAVQVNSTAVSGYSGTVTFITALSAQSRGQIYSTLKDNLSPQVTSNIKAVPRASIPLSLYDDGVDLGVTMGGIASAGGFRCLMDAYFGGDHLITALDFSNTTISKYFQYQVGETYSVGNAAIFPGFLTNEAKRFQFSILLPRSAAGRTVTVTQLNLNARANGGYIAGSGSGYNFLGSGITVSVAVDSSDGRYIRIRCDKTSAWGSNNTVVAVTPNTDIILSFS